MENNSHAEAEVILRRAVQPCRIVVSLDGANADAFARFDVNSAAERSRNAGVRGAKAFAAINGRLLAKRTGEKRIVNLRSAVRHADQTVTKRAKARAFFDVVFNLNATRKVVNRSVDLKAISGYRRAAYGRNVEFQIFIVSRKIPSHTNIAAKVADTGNINPVETRAVVEKISDIVFVVGDAEINLIVRVSAEDFKFVIIVVLTENKDA